MWTDKFQPLYAPEGEAGADSGTGGDAGGAPPPPPMNERPVDGPGSGRSELRKSLEKGFDDARKGDEQRDKGRQPQEGRDERTGQFTSRARREGIVTGEPEGQEQEAQQQEAGTQQQEQLAVPAGWSNEAKAEWERLPPTVQAAVAKRETDMAKGVDDLKKKYDDIDKALAPRMELIKRHNQTPGAAVNQLFAWFEALTANPLVAFPALAESFKFDLRSIPGLVAQQQQAQQHQEGQQQPAQEELPAYVKQLQDQIAQLQNGFQNQFGQLSQSYQQDKWNQLNTVLTNWSKDKPYFSDVRQTMGQLMNAGAVPPLPNGDADLDKAYDMALWAMPEVRTKVLAEQQQKAENERQAKAEKERKAQQEAADRARKANAGSLGQSAPGNPVQPDGKLAKKGKTVRESLMEARQELTER